MVEALSAVYLAALAAAGLLAFAKAPVQLWRAMREGRVLDAGSYHAVNALSVLVGLGWLAGLAVGFDTPLRGSEAPLDAWLRIVGLALALAGLGFSLWARSVLGASFAPTAAVPADRRVVDRGPYAWVRHPFYAGFWLAMGAGALALDSRLTLAAWLALTPLVWILAVLEERHLTDELGAAYRAYAERVPRLFPWRR